MKRFAAALAAVALTLAPRGLRAQNNLDTTFAVHGQPRLSVNNMSGRITVQAWSRPSVRLEAEYDRAQVEADVSSTRIGVRTISHRGDSEVDYTITVPVGTAVELSGISSDVDVSQVCGEVTVNVVSGDVHLTCAQGDISIQSVSGDVTIADVRSGDIEAGSTSGDVELRNVTGTINTRSVSGDITITDVESSDVGAESVSGDVSYDGRVADNGHYRFETHSGDVNIRALNSFSATVSVSTFSGDFEPDFPITITPGRQSPRDWEFTVGSGSARMSLRSFSGTISLHRGTGVSGRSSSNDDEN